MKPSNNHDVKIEVNELRSAGYTSLDTLQGKIRLNLRSELSINCIQIKFKGVNTTKLVEKTQLKNSDKKKSITKLEKHCIVDDIQTIFPKRSIDIDDKKVFNLRPGEYEYDFQFRIPLNSNCAENDEKESTKENNIFKLRRSSSSLLIINDSSNSGAIHHVPSILPPSFKRKNEESTIEYYLKVIIIRPSLLKSNIKKSKIIPIIPFNGVEYVHKSKNLNYIRKESVFKDKIPEIIAIIDTPSNPQNKLTRKTQQQQSESPKESTTSRLRNLLFGPSTTPAPNSDHSSKNLPPPLPRKNKEPPIIKSFDVPFYFEVRSYGFIQMLGKPLQLRLYLLSKINPKKYLGIDGKSSGLGSIYLSKFNIDLVTITKLKALDIVKVTNETTELTGFKTLHKFDLSKAQKSKALNELTGNALYELEMPKELYCDIMMPSHQELVPSFRTCNLERSYKLKISAYFNESADLNSKGNLVELDVPIDVLSGISPPMGTENQPPPTRNLPTYEEVIRTATT